MTLALGMGLVVGVLGQLDAGTPAPIQPPALLQDSPAEYPPELLSSRIAGDVELELLLDEQGRVIEVSLVRSDAVPFGNAAVQAAGGLVFSPAKADGVAVPSQLRYRYHFEPGPAPPPKGKLRGVVRSKGYRRPILGARVEVAGAATETDAAGKFELEVDPGEVRARVSAPGFKSAEPVEHVKADEEVSVLYALEPLVVDPYETIVLGERERTEVSRISLAPEETKTVPGTMGDPFRTILLLPGVGNLVSGASYPVVRGSQPAATGYFLDGVQVPILFHLFLGPAVVHPDFISSLNFFPGNAPAQYGRFLGAEVDAQLAHPRDDSVHATAYADLLNAGGFVEIPFPKSGTDVTVAGRVSYSPLLLSAGSQLIATETSAKFILGFGDYQARIEQKVGEGRLRLLVFGSEDEAGVDNVFTSGGSSGSGSVDALEVNFHRVDLRYRRPLLGGELELGGTAGVDHVENRFSSSALDQNAVGVDEQTLRARMVWSKELAPSLELKLGGDYDHRASQQHLTVTNTFGNGNLVTTQNDTPLASAAFFGGWAQVRWLPTPKVTVVPGIRWDEYVLFPGLYRSAVEPRLMIRAELTPELTVKAASGLFHQAPTALVALPSTEYAALGQGLQESFQNDVGVEWKPIPSLEVDLDGYFNRLTHTVELVPFTNGFTPLPGEDPTQGRLLPGSFNPVSNGHAYGLELLIRHRLSDRWFGWFSYSLSRSDRWEQFPRYDAHGVPYAQAQGYLPFSFDQTHIANLLLERKFWGHWTVGAAAHFNSGRPETGILTSQTEVPGATLAGTPRWIPVDADRSDRLPAFFRLDLRVSRTWAFEKFLLEAYLDVLNATVSQEVIQFQYNLLHYPTGPSFAKQPVAVPVVLPVLGVKGTY